MSRSRRGVAALVAGALLLVSVAVAPVATAQGECGLASADEVNQIFGTTDAVLSNGGPTFCGYTGSVNLTFGASPSGTVEQRKTEYPGGTDLTVAGMPAYLLPSKSQLEVQLPGRLFSAYAYREDATDLQAPLVALAELAIPRLPAGPDPADIARLEALVPDTLRGEPVTLQQFTGDLFLGFLDQTQPNVQAMLAAFAAQGKSMSDVLLVGTQTNDANESVAAVLVKGADVSSLILPLIQGFDAEMATAAVTTGDINGKAVTKVAADPPQTILSMGDVALVVTGPDDLANEVIGALP
jgi:hypothetical protein